MALTLDAALTRCRALQAGREVWVIVRYNNSDRNMDVFWSTADKSVNAWAPVKPPGWNPSDDEPFNAMQMNAKGEPKAYADGGPMSVLDNKRSGVRVFQCVGQNIQVSAAKHAEEYFIEAWNHNELGCSPQRPELVELFLRWSPCHHSSIALGPPGCSQKLRSLAIANPNIRFQIYYDEPYTGEGPGQFRDAVLGLNLLHNVTANSSAHYQPL